MKRLAALAIAVQFLCPSAYSAILRENTVVLLPLECSELLPDSSPFIRFFEAVARGNLRKDKELSRRVFRLLALRDKFQSAGEQARDTNPMDLLIRKTLCFYREKKEPLKAIPYDEPQFVTFLKGSMGDLEKKVDETIFQREFDKYQRREYEKLLTRNQQVEDKIRGKAEVDADRKFERLSSAARKKARIP